MGVLRIAAVDDVEERALDLLGDRSARSRTELDAVEPVRRIEVFSGAGRRRSWSDADKAREPAIAEDKDSSDTGQLPTFNAYSPDGDVTAQVVYVVPSVDVRGDRPRPQPAAAR